MNVEYRGYEVIERLGVGKVIAIKAEVPWKSVISSILYYEASKRKS